MEPYRSADGAEVVEAPTRSGTLRLEVAPRHVALTLGPTQLAITEQFVTVTEQKKRSVQRTSRRLGCRLVTARDVPHEDVGVWFENDAGRVQRLFGAEPKQLIEADGLPALGALDRLVSRLRQALQPWSTGVRRGIEVGRGLDKALLVDRGDHLVLYARPLFRDWAHRAVEVWETGKIVIPARAGDRVVTCRSRYGVTVIGDYIRFADPTGLDLAKVSIPWISREDRDELARRFGEMVDP